MLFLIFTVQLLAVEEWGRMHQNNSIQEETYEPLESSEEVSDSTEDAFFYTNHIHSSSKFEATKVAMLTMRTGSTHLYIHFSSETPTPPPIFGI